MGALVVYADLVAILNFCVDFLLLMAANRLTGFPMAAGRCALAALLGAVYAALCLVPGFSFLGRLHWRIISLLGMSGVAFGFFPGSLRRAGIFILLTFALGGVAMLLRSEDFFAPIAAAGTLWLLCRIGLRGRIGSRQLVNVQILGGRKPVRLVALRDTGNALRDPVSGADVLVVDRQAAMELTGLTAEQLRSPLETLSRKALPGLHLVPFRAVGSGSGLLLAKKYDVTIGNVRGPRLVAFAPDGLGGGDYRGLTGGSI